MLVDSIDMHWSVYHSRLGLFLYFLTGRKEVLKVEKSMWAGHI